MMTEQYLVIDAELGPRCNKCALSEIIKNAWSKADPPRVLLCKTSISYLIIT